MSAAQSVTSLIRLPGLRGIGGGWLVAACGVVLGALVLGAVLAPWLAPHYPTTTNLGNALAPPGGEHLLGTDHLGRDTLSRLMYGARTSLIGPLSVVVGASVMGVALGLVAGWKGGLIDAALTRVMDILFAFPGLLLAILAVALFGKGLMPPVIAMSIAYLPLVARQVRGLVQTTRARPYVVASLVQGFSPVRVVLRTVLPNIAPLLLGQSAVLFGYALLDLSALSFIGLGVQPPTADWGAMINEGRGALLLGEPFSVVVPCIAVIVTVVAFNVVGEGIADRIGSRNG